MKSGKTFFEKFFLDNPNKRSLHVKPVPSAGGLSFIIPLLIYDFISAYFNNSEGSLSISLFCIPLIFISFLDDLIKVSSAINTLDKEAGFVKYYGRNLPDPVETIFNTRLS